MDLIGKFIWHEAFWLPKNYTWKDLENKPGSTIYLPQREDMLWSVFGGLVLLVIRYVFERFISTPIGYKLGIKEKRNPILKPNPVLEEEYQRNGLVTNNNLEDIGKKTDMSVREVERWLRDRKIMSKPLKIKKFNDCSWHFLFYSFSFTYGIVVLWDKPWLWETNFCWKNWPYLDVSQGIYWFYMIELSFYWCLVYTMLSDHKRKDFTQMVVHHVATILLVYFSWADNFVRIGTLILVAHDIGDIPLAIAKMLHYCGMIAVPDALFAVFIVVWILSRLIYYPFVAVNSAIFECWANVGPYPAHYFFITLLIALQILHLIWTYLIAKIVFVRLWKGESKDIRSDSESD